MTQTEEQPQDLIGIARIARPQGVRGEVIAELMTDFPDRFRALETVKARRPDGVLLHLKLAGHRMHKGRILLRFEGYDTVERAEELRNATLVIEKDRLVALPADSYYHFDLVDCRVVTSGGRDLGRVAAVQDFGASPLLVVVGEDSGGRREFMIPFTRDICPKVDIAGKLITVDPPDGLLDL